MGLKQHRYARIWVGIIAIIVIILVILGAWMMLGKNEIQQVKEVPSVEKTKKGKTNASWIDLTPSQKEILAPLEPEWNKMGAVQKKKWLKIAQKLESLPPEEKQRGQERIREWSKLTPEQRRVARQNFIEAKKLNSQKKSEQWQAYQKLPEEKKKELASRGKSKRQVINPKTAPQKKSEGDASTQASNPGSGGDSTTSPANNPDKKEGGFQSDQDPIYWR